MGTVSPSEHNSQRKERGMTTETVPEATAALNQTAADANALREKLADALTSGFQAELDPEEAERAGAFQESALSEQDAADSADDLSAALEEFGVSP